MKDPLSALPEEEKAALRKREVIPKDDPTAICNQPQTALGPQNVKEPDVPNGQVWFAQPDVGSTLFAYIEAERFIDVKSFAAVLFGVGSPAVKPVGAGWLTPPRYQLKWGGSALDPHDPKTLIFRDLRNENAQWAPLRDLNPSKTQHDGASNG